MTEMNKHIFGANSSNHLKSLGVMNPSSLNCMKVIDNSALYHLFTIYNTVQYFVKKLRFLPSVFCQRKHVLHRSLIVHTRLVN